MADLKTMTPEQFIMEALPGALAQHKDDLKGFKAVVQWKLTGAGGGDFYLDTNDQTTPIKRGVHPTPNVTLEMAADTMMTLVRGEAVPMQLMSEGKVKLTGNPGMVLPLQVVFMTARKTLTNA
jgi:putative sterol carrier protein